MKTRIKGDQFEFHIQKEINSLIEDLGLKCSFKRVGMSGSLDGKKGDFEWKFRWKKLRGEAKKGNQVPATLYNWLDKDNSDFLIVARDRQPPLLVIKLDQIEPLLTCQEGDYEDVQLPLQPQNQVSVKV